MRMRKLQLRLEWVEWVLQLFVRWRLARLFFSWGGETTKKSYIEMSPADDPCAVRYKAPGGRRCVDILSITMVRVSSPARPSSAATWINQLYEGHGLATHPPHERGFCKVVERLSTSSTPSQIRMLSTDSTDTNSCPEKSHKAVSSEKGLCIHAHVRDKVISIHAGSGQQCIHWLGSTAVHRYLSQPQAYSMVFSLEMIANAVIVGDGTILSHSARIRDELADGVHVWIDVGDGTPMSQVRSRTFPDRQLLEPLGHEHVQEHVYWGRTEPDQLDDEIIGIDPRITMTYVRTVIAKQPTFREWQKLQPASAQSSEGLFESFDIAWQRVCVEDLPGSGSWLSEVKGALFHHFETISYIFNINAAVGAEPSAATTMSLLDFWSICKRSRLPSPYCNIARINGIFSHKTSLDACDIDLHNPHRSIELHEFMSAITRISLMRQASETSPPEPLPGCLIRLLKENFHIFIAGAEPFDANQSPTSLFASPAVRQKLTIHEARLALLFHKWATVDVTHKTINLVEWLDMFAASNVMGTDLTKTKLQQAFVQAQLGEHEGVVEARDAAGEKACPELIFTEFVDAIFRVALVMHADDVITPADLKLHEICLLLEFGPAGGVVA